MGIIKSVLKEELENAKKMVKRYNKELENLQHGSLILKERRNKHKYYYVAVREKGRVKFIYKGKLSKEEIRKFKQEKQLHQKYKRLIDKLNKRIKFLERSIKKKADV